MRGREESVGVEYVKRGGWCLLNVVEEIWKGAARGSEYTQTHGEDRNAL